MVGGLGCRGFRLRYGCAVAAVGLLAVAGCSGQGAPPQSTPEVAVARIDSAIHDPVWSYRDHTLLGITDDHRLAQISYSGLRSARTRLADAIATGRNLQISRKNDRHVFVPQPEHGRVAVVDLVDLRVVDEFDAGPAPAYLAEDAGMRVLLALSANGSSVTPVEEYGYRKLPTARLTGAPAQTIGGANRERAIAFHTYGPSGVRYYKGFSAPPEERGSFAIPVGASAGDGTAITRSYLAAPNSNVLQAIGVERDTRGIDEAGRAQLSSPIRYLGTDDTRIYAATDQNVTVLETESFINYLDRTIPIVRVVDYRAELPDGPAKKAPLSGMAIAADRVYLTFRGQPYVVSVAKPRI